MNMLNEFQLYSKSKGLNGSHLDLYSSSISNLTPYILEERELRVTQMDVFSRLLKDRIIWLSGPVNQHMGDIVQAQLLFLDSVEKSDITLYINTPGGSVMNGLGIVDVMNYIGSDVATVNIGIAASMGSVLLGAGTKGKRSSLRFSRTMLHQSSGGAGGNIQDAEITMREWIKLNDTLFNLLGEYCEKDPEQVKKDASRDLWLDSQAALEYGIIDDIVLPKGKKVSK